MQALSLNSTKTSVHLPQTDLEVSTICLGTGSLGSDVLGADANKTLDAFHAYGGTFIDTAHNYGDWVEGIPRSASERIIGTWLEKNNLRSRMVIATKGGHFYFDSPDKPRLSKADLCDDLEGSLSALQTDYVDLYWLHRDDPKRPVEDIIGTLNEFVDSGKIRYFGASNWKTSRLIEAQNFAKAANLRGFVADQPLWNAAVLAGPPYGDPTTSWMDDERYQFHKTSGMAVIPYQSQAYGLFRRMYQGTLEFMNQGFRSFYKPDETAQRYNRMCEIMAETGLSITQMTLGYLISQPFTTVPIVGCKDPSQVIDSLSALPVRLTAEQVHYIETGQVKAL